MKILITGYKGFIGNHLWNKLNGHDLIGIDKKEGTSSAIYENIPPCDLIVHLGASCSTQRSLDNPLSDFEDNALGTLNISYFAATHNIPVIYTSTCKVHPNSQGIRTPYGLSKYVGELYIKEFAQIHNLSYVINRPGTIYGDGQEGSSESGWVSWFLKASRERLPITIYGDGNQVRDILHVDDYTNLLVSQISNFDAYKGKTFEVGGGEANAITLLQLLEFIGYDNYTFDEQRVGDARRYVADNSMVSDVDGWKPWTPWREGIRILQ